MLRRRPNLAISLPSLSSQSEPVTPNVYNTYSPRNLYGGRQIKLYKGIFSLVLITCIVTVFYLGFYVLLVNPKITAAVKNLLMSSQTNPNSQAITKIQNILGIFVQRENDLIN